MKQSIVLSLYLWVSFSIYPAQAGDFLSEGGVGNVGGKDYHFEVSAKELSRAPQWKDGDPFPPLPPLKAREIALKKARELCPSVKSWQADSITLRHIIYSTDADKPPFWIYVIRCYEIEDGIITGMPCFLEIPVMMNGVAVEPLINPKFINGESTK